MLCLFFIYVKIVYIISYYFILRWFFIDDNLENLQMAI